MYCNLCKILHDLVIPVSPIILPLFPCNPVTLVLLLICNHWESAESLCPMYFMFLMDASIFSTWFSSYKVSFPNLETNSMSIKAFVTYFRHPLLTL